MRSRVLQLALLRSAMAVVGVGCLSSGVLPAAEKSTSSEAPPPATKKEPKYFGLRYLEDWSYLEGPEDGHVNDHWDPIKNIDLGGDWRVDFGGSIRFRGMFETNKRYGADRTTQDSYLLQQYLVHANFRYCDIFRIFIEGIHAAADERQTPALDIDENFYDVHQAFADLRVFGSGTPVILRFGRQELLFGNERLVSPLAWANTRRIFDGADLLWRSERWHVDAFYVRPVPIDRTESLDRKWDEYDADQHFFGIHSTYKGWQDHGADGYYLVLLDDESPPNSAGARGHLTVHTVGSRWWGKTGPWDYEAEGAMQFGHFAGDEIFAWMLALEGGYSFADWPMTPRLALGFDWATGDHEPTDNQHNTFNQLFPLGHKYFGYLDQVGRQNILDPHIELSFAPCKPVRMAVAYHQFFLDQNDDALYNAAGAPVRRDPRGESGSAIGGELDVTLNWKIDRHQALLLGWSHLWPGGFIDQTGDNDAPDLFYVQYLYTF